MGKLELHFQILIAMIAGTLVGFSLYQLAEQGVIATTIPQQAATFGHGLGELFLRLLKMVVVPLIITSLVTGVLGMGDLSRLGPVGGRTMAFYMGSSMLAILTGLLMVNLIQPGMGADLELLKTVSSGSTTPEIANSDKSLLMVLWEQFSGMIPTNPIAAAAESDMLPVIFFSLLFGTFLAKQTSPAGERFKESVGVGFDVMMQLTIQLIRLAPLGVFGYMVFAIASQGLQIFNLLGRYMLTVALALITHAVLTLPLLLWLMSKRSPLTFVKAMAPALLTAFSTASSNATLPLTMRSIQERAGVSKEASAFVLPLGATINMDGTALYEVVAVLFIAQLFGNDLSLAQQVAVALTALLASIGAAGIPHAGTVMMVVVLDTVGLPTDTIALILGVDRFLDMARTTVNVWSDATATAIIDRTLGNQAQTPAIDTHSA